MVHGIEPGFPVADAGRVYASAVAEHCEHVRLVECRPCADTVAEAFGEHAGIVRE